MSIKLGVVCAPLPGVMPRQRLPAADLMKFSALICTPLAPGFLAYLTGDLFHRGVLPELFLSEKLGAGTLRIRLELECTPEMMDALQVYWKTYLKAQAVVVSAVEKSVQPVVLPSSLSPAPKSGQPTS